MSRQNKPRTSCIWCGKSDHVRKSSKKCEFYNGKTSAIPTQEPTLASHLAKT